MAPGLRHLARRRPDARSARDERRDLPRRGERVQRPADVHPRQPQARRARRGAGHGDHQLSALGDQPRQHPQAGRARRHRRAEGRAGIDDPVPRLPGARLGLEPLAVEPRQRLFVAMRGLEPHPALQAPGLHRPPRLHPDPGPARRLPAQALRRLAPLEGRHAARGAAGRAQSRLNGDRPHFSHLPQMSATPDPEYEAFRTYPDRGAADSMCSWLEFEGVPAYVRPRALSAAMEAEFVVFVLKKLAHRARWIVQQLPPTDAELEYLATGKLPGKDVVMVTVEADAFCGPLLARKAAEAGVVYSLAYGDQPALICDLVDWARTAGFPVVAAGRGRKWLPHFAQSTPETVWGYYGLTPEQARVGGLNPKMFNSFLDGSKPAIEATAVCNATGLTPAPEGLAYPPASVEDLPLVMRPKSEGGQLHHKGQVEVVSSLDRDGRAIPYDIRFGVWVVFEGESDYIRRCFMEYGVRTDPSGRYAAMYKRWHLIGLEVGISVASVGLRREPTGCATGFRADAVATAKRDLGAGEILDGEGGYTVVGRLVSAADSLELGGLPLGLAQQVKLVNPVKAGQVLRWADVAYDAGAEAVRVRREMESIFVAPKQRAA